MMMQKDINPDQNKSAWSCSYIAEMKTFLGMTFLMVLDVKTYINYIGQDIAKKPNILLQIHADNEVSTFH